MILGAIGDFGQRKLGPGLFNLRDNGQIPEHLRIAGFTHSPYSDNQLRGSMSQAVRGLGRLAAPQHQWAMLVQTLFYVSETLAKNEDRVRLKE